MLTRRLILSLVPISIFSFFVPRRADALPQEEILRTNLQPVRRGNQEFSHWDEQGRVTLLAFRIGALGDERDWPLDEAHMADLFAEMERWDARVSAMHLSSAELTEVMSFDPNVLDRETHRELLDCGLHATLWGAQVRCHNILPPGVVLFTSDAFGEALTHDQWKHGVTVNDSIKHQELWLPIDKQPIVGYRPLESSINRMRTEEDPASTHIWNARFKTPKTLLDASIRGIGFPIEFGHE